MSKWLKGRLVTDHGSEILLLGLIAAGVLWVLYDAIGKQEMVDVAAFLLILQRIVEAVQKRWEQRSSDQKTELLGKAAAVTGGEDGGN